MEEFFEVIQTSIEHFTLLDILDILLVAVVIYSLLKITSKTRAIQVLKGYLENRVKKEWIYGA